MKLDTKIGRSLKKASPTILTCIGAAGVVATAVLAVKATPKADSLIKADSRRNHDGDPYAATKLEAVKSCWKCYIPAAATGVATIICIFGANTLNKKQQASLASAYALVNRSYSDYKHKLKELYGEDAHKKIMESIAAEKSSMPPITAKDAEDKEGLDGFQYDEYCVEVESWPGLAASVRENYDTYLAKGKDDEVDRSNDALFRAQKNTDSIVQDTDAMSVDHEYRLTLLELGLSE